MTRHQAESFIRKTLGCRCPPEMFDDLRDETDLARGPLYDAFSSVDVYLPPLVDRILSVGGRLLVVVTRASGQETVNRMLEAGRRVRDVHGFNRFRLVVVSPDGRQPADKTVPARFDDRVHLHCIGTTSSKGAA